MPRYRYKALNRWGDPLTGEREADDPRALKVSLAAEGLELREAEIIPDPYTPRAEPATTGTPTAASSSDIAPSRGPIEEKWSGVVGADLPGAEPLTPADELTAAEARELAEQLAGLSAAGLPLHSGLRAAAEELRDGSLRRALLDLAARLESGLPPEEAIEQAGDRLPGHLRGLVLAAAKSGRIGNVLGEFVSYASAGAALRRSLWMGLAYPLLLVAFLALVFGFATLVVVPGFKGIFQDFGVNLPSATMFLIHVSDAVLERGSALLGLTVGGVLVLWVAARFLLDPPTRRRLFCRIPLVGPLWRWTALAEFSHYLGLLVDSGLTLPRALPLAARGARDPDLEAACEQVAVQVAAGRSLSEALAWWGAIPRGLVTLLQWSEGRQSLGEALHMAGSMFEARARSQAAFVGAVSIVLAVVLVLWGAALLVVGLFLPLVQLISVLSG